MYFVKPFETKPYIFINWYYNCVCLLSTQDTYCIHKLFFCHLYFINTKHILQSDFMFRTDKLEAAHINNTVSQTLAV